MASFTERIRIIIDASADKATSAFGNIRKAVSDAEGPLAKMKAGWSSAMQGIQANATGLAAAAAPAIVAFALKAGNAVSELAKQSIDLSKATGLSTEQASRWIAVADDYEVSAETLATAIGRISKNIDSAKFDQYGIATRDASGEARSANSIFLDVLDTLNRTPNETERARIAAELLGKGWQGIAPLLGHSRDEYEKMLSAVEAGQVITEAEARRAENWRKAQDKLADALKEFQYAVGDTVVSLGPLIDKLADVVELAGKLDFMLPSADAGSATEWLQDLATAARESGDALAYLKSKGFTEDQAEKILAGFPVAEGVVRGFTVALEGANEELAGVSVPAERAKEKIDDLRGAYADLRDDIAADNSLLDMADSFDRVRERAVEAFVKTTKGSKDAEQANRDYQRSVNDLKQQVLDYAEAHKEIPKETISNIIAMIDEGKLDEAELALAGLEKERRVEVTVDTFKALAAIATINTALDNMQARIDKAQGGGGIGYPTPPAPPGDGGSKWSESLGGAPSRGEPGDLGDINLNLILGDQAIQAITIRGEQLKRGRR